MKTMMHLDQADLQEAAADLLDKRGFSVVGEVKIDKGAEIQVSAEVEKKPKRQRAAPAE